MSRPARCCRGSADSSRAAVRRCDHLAEPRSEVRLTDHLTALDAAFLELEEGDSSAHMHIGWTMVFDPLPRGGTPAVDEVRRLLAERLSLLPRFSRRLSEP